MDNIVYLDYKARELENLLSGKKTLIIRGAMGRKLPYERVNCGDVLYFVENNGEGLIKAKAIVQDVINSGQLTREQSDALVKENQKGLQLNSSLIKRFSGKRYLVLITVKDFTVIEPFRFDRSEFSNMDDWLAVGDINKVKKS